MADKDFRVKNKLHVNGLNNASGVILATNNALDSHTTLPTQYGGTGTTTSPNAGQILYSSSGTNYTPTTLSSLVTPVTYSADAPASPVTGQIWVESDSATTAFDPNIVKRQSFTATAAQTVFTTSHTWIEGYEQVYLNGLLLLRTTDYTTSNTNTVTLVEAAAVNDILEVVTVTNFNVNVSGYTQDAAPSSATDGQIWLDTDGTLADAAFIPNTLTTTTGDIIYASAANTPARRGIGTSGQVLTVSGGVPVWATASISGLTKIVTADFSNSAGVQVNGCFTSTYKNYIIVIDNLNSGSNASDVYLQFQYSTSTVQSTAYYSGAYYMQSNSATGNYNISNGSYVRMGQWTNLPMGAITINVSCVGNSSQRALFNGIGNGANSSGVSIFGGYVDSPQIYTGFKIYGASNITGTYTVYGLAV